MLKLKKWISLLLAFAIVICLVPPVRVSAEDTDSQAATESAVMPEETEAQETESQETEPQETESQETEPQETESQETEPQETESQETEPQETEPQETEPEETEPEETEPEADLPYIDIEDGLSEEEYTRSNYAYRKGVADPVFAYTDNLMQYTNVLVGFNNDQCKDDIAMRPYMILQNADGEQVTIYGGIVYRSIGYIAWQNRSVFEPGTAAYEYVWDIIHYVYGDQYDEDYEQ